MISKATNLGNEMLRGKDKQTNKAGLTPKPMFLNSNLFLFPEFKSTCAFSIASNKRCMTFPQYIFTYARVEIAQDMQKE